VLASRKWQSSVRALISRNVASCQGHIGDRKAAHAGGYDQPAAVGRTCIDRFVVVWRPRGVVFADVLGFIDAARQTVCQVVLPTPDDPTKARFCPARTTGASGVRDIAPLALSRAREIA